MSSADFRSYKRVYAKFRRLGYYVSEAEDNYKILLYDELKAAKIYDFTEFNASFEPAQEKTEGEEAKKDETEKEETKKEEKTASLLDKMEEARVKDQKDAEEKKDPEIVKKGKFEVDLDKIDLTKMDDFKK